VVGNPTHKRVTRTVTLASGAKPYTSTIIGSLTDTIEIGKTSAGRSKHSTVTSTIMLASTDTGYTSTNIGPETDTLVIGSPAPTAYPTAHVTITSTVTLASTDRAYTSTITGLAGTNPETDTIIIGSPTPSSTVTNPILPTFVPSDGGTLKCPDDKGKNHTIGAAIFQVTCYDDYLGQDLESLSTPSLEACGATCETKTKCKNAVWVPRSSDGACYLKTGSHNNHKDYYLMGLRLLYAPGGRDENTSTGSTTSTVVPITTATDTPSDTTPINLPEETSSVSCGSLNHKGNTFFLRTHVIFGSEAFENLYLQKVAYGK
jgi:hypothetical protein